MKTLTLPLLLVTASAYAQSPFATSVVSSTGLTGTGLYNDPAAALGKPTTRFQDWDGPHRAKLTEGAYNVAPTGEKLITKLNEGTSLTVAFDHDVVDDPNNPFGLDFIVFGNAFFLSNGFSDDTTDMNTFGLLGDVFAQPFEVAVSQNGTDWFSYGGATPLPTNAYLWDRANARWTDTESDFTKPLDPTLTPADFGGTAADGLDLYDGSGGGMGFDLALSGLSSIRYIRVSGTAALHGGSVDAFSDVAPVPEPASLAALGLGLAALARRKKAGK